jgi:hypothetical protein
VSLQVDRCTGAPIVDHDVETYTTAAVCAATEVLGRPETLKEERAFEALVAAYSAVASLDEELTETEDDLATARGDAAELKEAEAAQEQAEAALEAYEEAFDESGKYILDHLKTLRDRAIRSEEQTGAWKASWSRESRARAEADEKYRALVGAFGGDPGSLDDRITHAMALIETERLEAAKARRRSVSLERITRAAVLGAQMQAKLTPGEKKALLAIHELKPSTLGKVGGRLYSAGLVERGIKSPFVLTFLGRVAAGLPIDLDSLLASET